MNTLDLTEAQADQFREFGACIVHGEPVWDDPHATAPETIIGYRAPQAFLDAVQPCQVRTRCPKHMGHLAFTEHGASGVFDTCPNCTESSGYLVLGHASVWLWRVKTVMCDNGQWRIGEPHHLVEFGNDRRPNVEVDRDYVAVFDEVAEEDIGAIEEEIEGDEPVSNDWGDDDTTVAEIEDAMDIEIPLTPRQIMLRDGVELPTPGAGEARKARLIKLERNHTACMDFVGDLDRYAEHAAQVVLVGDQVGPYMMQMLSKLRRKTVKRCQELRAELDYVRRLP